MAFKNLKSFKEEVQSNAALQEQLRQDPVGTMQKIAPQPLPNNTVYWIIVSVVGATVIFIVLGIIIAWLARVLVNVNDIPTVLVTLSSGALGALTGLLVPTPQQQEGNS